MGGVRDKVLAARRGGIRHVLLPARNRGDLDELPPEAAEGLRFTFVENIGDVLFALFPAATAAAGDGIDVSPPPSEEEEEAAAAAAAAGVVGGDARSAGFHGLLPAGGGRGTATAVSMPQRQRQRQTQTRDPGVSKTEAAEEEGGGRCVRGDGWEAEDVSGVLLESFL